MTWHGLLAEVGHSSARVRGISRSFGATRSSGGQEWLLYVLLGLVVVLIITVAVHWLRQRRREREVRRPEQLFQEALASLKMSPEDTSLLLRMVRELKVPQPTALLLNPEQFQQAVEQWVTRAGPERADSWRQRLMRIGERAFSGQTSVVQ